jgi:hypothetical protein
MKWYFYSRLAVGALVELLALGLIYLLCQASFYTRQALRPLAVLLLLCCLWPALTASAPAPQACDVAANGVQIRRRIEVERGGITVPIGQIETSWSCTAAEAEAKAAELEAEVRSRAGVAAAPKAAGLLEWLATVRGK